jgi:hypothetical protein
LDLRRRSATRPDQHQAICQLFGGVITNGLPAHKAAGVREAVEARGAMLRYLPKYSPELNPHRVVRPQRHRPRSRQLFQARRLCVKSIEICSSLRAPHRAHVSLAILDRGRACRASQADTDRTTRW